MPPSIDVDQLTGPTRPASTPQGDEGFYSKKDEVPVLDAPIWCNDNNNSFSAVDSNSFAVNDDKPVQHQHQLDPP